MIEFTDKNGRKIIINATTFCADRTLEGARKQAEEVLLGILAKAPSEEFLVAPEVVNED